jgi:hypothetical protein
MEEIAELLKPYNCTRSDIEDLVFPLEGQDGRTPLLVLPSSNILEIMEEALEEEDSLSEFVETQLASVKSMSKLDALRSIVSAYLHDVELPPEQKKLDDKDEAGIYATYALVWEGHEMLDEQRVEAKIAYPAIDSEWAASRAEDGALLLALQPDESFHAPLIIPMGGLQ